MKTLKHLIGGIQQSILTINLKKEGRGGSNFFVTQQRDRPLEKSWGEGVGNFFSVNISLARIFFKANAGTYIFSALRRA